MVEVHKEHDDYYERINECVCVCVCGGGGG